VDPPFPDGGAAVNQLQRAGLAFDQGRVLIGYGGNDGDCQTYWGWLVSAPTDGTTGPDAFQVDAGHAEGAIWAAGNAPPIDGAGNAFLATGNGAGNGTSDPAYGDSVVKLNAAAAVLDWWAPPNWQTLDATDADLGSSMPTLLPGGSVFQSGKDGSGYLLDGAALGHVSSAAARVSGFCSGGSFGGSVYDSATATLYVTCGGGLQALTLGSGSPPAIASTSGFSAPPDATGPPMIAGGLVWVTNYASGTLYGLDPASGTTRSHLTIPEDGTNVNHFATASAGGGRLFVGTGDQVTAVTIARPPGLTPTTSMLVSSANPVAPRTSVSLTAAVAPAPDGGTVTFTDGGAPIAGCSGLAVTIAAAGLASCRTAFPMAGAHTIVASYSGDPFYAASSSPGLAESVVPSTGSRAHRAPVIGGASLTPRRFAASQSPTLRLTLSAPGTVAVAITQARRGHLVGRSCRRGPRLGRSCVVQVRLKLLRFPARAGRRAFKLKLRGLARGRYTALIDEIDRARHGSRTISIRFTIIR
jgi:Bacterial Ig-like domain (group 3)